MQKSHPTNTRPSRRLIRRNHFSSHAFLGFCLVFAAVGGYLIWRSFAAPTPPTIYLTPATLTKGGTTSFSVQVRENSGTTSVNAVQANLSYDANLIDFVSVDTTGTAFTTEAQSSGGAGAINIGRGTCGGCAALTGDQLVATINFKTKAATGAATVSFTNGTALVSSSSNTDILGSLSATAGGTYTTDTTAPAVSITAPANNATLASGSTVNVTASASDSTSSVSKVEIYVDGSLAKTLTASPYTYAWPTTGLTLAAHTLQAKAYDTVGNVGTSSSVTVTFTDQTAPSTPTNFRSTGSALNSISLAWNASSDNVGVTGYLIKRGGATIATVTSGLTYTDTGLTSSTSYSYSIQALDAAQNASGVATLTTSTSSPKSGDINGDNSVDVTDLSILLSNWQKTTASADLNKDGIVDIFDLSILLSHYGT